MNTMVWNLDSLYAGGSQSEEFQKFLLELEQDVAALRDKVQGVDLPVLLVEVQEIEARVQEADAFKTCLLSQNTLDEEAKLLSGRTASLSASFATVQVLLDQRLAELDESTFAHLLEDPNLFLIALPLRERRQRVTEMLGVERESLIHELQVDGFHANYDLYNKLMARLSIQYQQEGETVQASFGQGGGMLGSGDRGLRATVNAAMEQALADDAELFVHVLNHSAGFRLNVYRQRGWDSILKESLDLNRMSEQTLTAMWQAVEKHKGLLVQFLNRKAQLLGLEKLSCYDVRAPLTGKQFERISYQTAIESIIGEFAKFSPDMAAFAQRAFQNQWIEAEERPNKLHTNFCLNFPSHNETRIFTTFDGTTSSVCMLAHELGHAYHDHVMNDLPQMARNYPMSLAETASTFSEMVVENMALASATTREERIACLETKAMTAVTNFMNAHYLFLFEKEFYERRKNGLVSVAETYSIDRETSERSYAGALDHYFSGRWMQFPHLYQTEVPFYSYAYVFGYLFSNGLYAKALEEGPQFAKTYARILGDTGRCTVEEVALQHLGVDITQPEFWERACKESLKAVEEFLRITG